VAAELAVPVYSVRGDSGLKCLALLRDSASSSEGWPPGARCPVRGPRAYAPQPGACG
jgi:hypothetical protein